MTTQHRGRDRSKCAAPRTALSQWLLAKRAALSAGPPLFGATGNLQQQQDHVLSTHNLVQRQQKSTPTAAKRMGTFLTCR
jgi:hypothetical protein